MDNEDEGARLTRREENRELIAKHRATVEPKGCPTPGSCSAVEELADLKQRLLPQANGRAERAEKARQMAVVERDEMLEKLIVRQTTIANLHDVIDGMRGAARSATAATDFFNFLESAAQDIDYNPEGGGELSGVEAVLEFLHEPLVYEVLNRKAAPVEETAPKGSALNTLDIIANWGDEENEWDAVVKYRSVRDMAKTRVAILRSYMKGQPDRPDWAQQLPGAEIFDRSNDAGEKP